ncbi:MAG: helix-turn-helix transcriptional regulator [Oscillospiraceae bacterium]
MNINDIIENAKTTNWLANGLTTEEINQTKKLAIIAAKIQLKRIELGMNQKEFAKFMCVSQGMISKWESGEYNFTITTIDEICEKLKLDFSPLITPEKCNYNTGYTFIKVSISPKHMAEKFPHNAEVWGVIA